MSEHQYKVGDEVIITGRTDKFQRFSMGERVKIIEVVSNEQLFVTNKQGKTWYIWSSGVSHLAGVESKDFRPATASRLDMGADGEAGSIYTMPDISVAGDPNDLRERYKEAHGRLPMGESF